MSPIKIVATLIAVTLLVGYLGAIVLKLKELDLAAVVAIGIVLMLVDAVQSLRSRDT